MNKQLVVALGFLTMAFTSAAGFAQTETETEPTEPNSEVLQFRNWAVQCAQNQPEQPKRCTLFQRLNTKEGQTILMLSVGFQNPEEDATIGYQLPLGIALQAGVSIQVDDQDRGKLGYTHCIATGCYAFQVLHQELLTAFKAGKSISVNFNTLQNQTVNVPVSLYGFSAGFDTLEERNIKAQE